MYVDGFWEIYLRDISSNANLLANGFSAIESEHWRNDEMTAKCAVSRKTGNQLAG